MNIPDLLAENRSVRQRPDEGFRRWFANSYFELIVWYDRPGGELKGFQLCLSRNNYERAFTWTPQYVSSHRLSEGGPGKGLSNLSTGILKGDGNVVAPHEVQRFESDSASLEPELAALVLRRIREYNQRRAGS